MEQESGSSENGQDKQPDTSDMQTESSGKDSGQEQSASSSTGNRSDTKITTTSNPVWIVRKNQNKGSIMDTSDADKENGESASGGQTSSGSQGGQEGSQGQDGSELSAGQKQESGAGSEGTEQTAGEGKGWPGRITR